VRSRTLRSTPISRLIWRVLTPLLALPALAYAHPGRAPEPHDAWRAWSFAPLVVASLVIPAGAYVTGVRALWARAGRGRGIAISRVASFALGMLALALALLSPVDAMGDALFSAHMLQHMLLVMVAAPLVVLGEPQYVALWMLRVGARRTLARWWVRSALHDAWRILRQPVIAWVLHVGTLWLWHVPRFYEAALRSPTLHIAEHVSFFATGMLFWWVVLAPRALRTGTAVLLLFTAALQCTLLGALLTMTRHPWYASHAAFTHAWGLTPLEDQQIAGLIMWVPGGLAYLLAAIARLAPALREATAAPQTRLSVIAHGEWRSGA
jgi:cytochrome c oxidase assembly factor CtaG